MALRVRSHLIRLCIPPTTPVSLQVHVADTVITDEVIASPQVDCTSPGGDLLCVKHRVDAFPTILVFRKDDTVRVPSQWSGFGETLDCFCC